MPQLCWCPSQKPRRCVHGPGCPQQAPALRGWAPAQGDRATKSGRQRALLPRFVCLAVRHAPPAPAQGRGARPSLLLLLLLLRERLARLLCLQCLLRLRRLQNRPPQVRQLPSRRCGGCGVPAQHHGWTLEGQRQLPRPLPRLWHPCGHRTMQRGRWTGRSAAQALQLRPRLGQPPRIGPPHEHPPPQRRLRSRLPSSCGSVWAAAHPYPA